MTHPIATDHVYVGRALISVSDKSGLLDLARALTAMGVELISTGGTSGMLRTAGLAVRDVSEVTGFPEMMDGRVKTLHPNVHGGLLALRDDNEHLLAMAAHGIDPIDLLIVNLYPFEETVAKGGDHAACIEPQSGPPDAFNGDPEIVDPGARLTHWFEIRWSASAALMGHYALKGKKVFTINENDTPVQ